MAGSPQKKALQKKLSDRRCPICDHPVFETEKSVRNFISDYAGDGMSVEDILDYAPDKCRLCDEAQQIKDQDEDEEDDD